MNSTLISALHLVFSAGVFVLALFAWSKAKSALVLLTGIAFGLFAISHLVVIFGLAESAEGLIILLNVLGYALVLVAYYKEMSAKRPTTPPAGSPK